MKLRSLRFLLLYLFLFVVNIGISKAQPLAGKKIYVDAGHGGTADSDGFRQGIDGEREEWINLRVALLLGALLEEAGAVVRQSREEDVHVDLAQRAEEAIDFQADLFISIHHNATADTSINFPIIYFHGNAMENGRSVALAKIVGESIRKNLFYDEGPLEIVSDHVIFPNSGTRVLRNLKSIPGIIGEASFFTHPAEEQLLKTRARNQLEAKAYFEAIVRYFDAKLYFVKNTSAFVKPITPFPVLQEAERNTPEAKAWKAHFDEGEKLMQTATDKAAMYKALQYFEMSIRAFPDSYKAGEAHYLRGLLYKMLHDNKKAEAAFYRVRAHYPNFTFQN